MEVVLIFLDVGKELSQVQKRDVRRAQIETLSATRAWDRADAP